MTEISRDPKRGSRVLIESIRKVKIGNWTVSSIPIRLSASAPAQQNAVVLL